MFGQGCYVAPTVMVGDRVKVQNGVSLYDGVILEDDVFCGPHMIFTNVVNPRAFIERKREYRPIVSVAAPPSARARSFSAATASASTLSSARVLS